MWSFDHRRVALAHSVIGPFHVEPPSRQVAQELRYATIALPALMTLYIMTVLDRATMTVLAT